MSLLGAPKDAEPVDRMAKPCRYCGAPFGYRVLVKRHWELYCGACGAYVANAPKERTGPEFRVSIPASEMEAWGAAVERLCRALYASPTLRRYRAMEDDDLEIPAEWEGRR